MWKERFHKICTLPIPLFKTHLVLLRTKFLLSFPGRAFPKIFQNVLNDIFTEFKSFSWFSRDTFLCRTVGGSNSIGNGKISQFLKKGEWFFSSNPYKKTNLIENVRWCIFSKIEISLLSLTSSPRISHSRVIEIEKYRDFSPFSSSSKKLVNLSIFSEYSLIIVYLPTTCDSWWQ